MEYEALIQHFSKQNNIHKSFQDCKSWIAFKQIEVCCVWKCITEKETCHKAQTLFGKVNDVNVDNTNQFISKENTV